VGGRGGHVVPLLLLLPLLLLQVLLLSSLFVPVCCACPCPFIYARLCWLALVGPLFVLTSPCSYSPPLVRAGLRSFAGPRLSPLVCPCSVALAGPRAHRHLFMPFTTCACPLPLVCACLRSLAGPRLSPPVCVRLCWFPLGCACPRCLVAFVWLLLVLVGVCLGSFVLI
jgi:hypothetical protein